MEYTLARPQIKTGDVVCVRGDTLFARVTKLVQHIAAWRNPALKPFVGVTHCGIAAWVGGALECAEMDGRYAVKRRMSQHMQSGATIDVYRCPAPDEMAVLDVINGEPLDKLVHYGLWDLAKIALRGMFGLGTGGDTSDDKVCTSWVLMVLLMLKWQKPAWLQMLCLPAEMALALHEQGLLRMEWITQDAPT